MLRNRTFEGKSMHLKYGAVTAFENVDGWMSEVKRSIEPRPFYLVQFSRIAGISYRDIFSKRFPHETKTYTSFENCVQIIRILNVALEGVAGISMVKNSKLIWANKIKNCCVQYEGFNFQKSFKVKLCMWFHKLIFLFIYRICLRYVYIWGLQIRYGGFNVLHKSR